MRVTVCETPHQMSLAEDAWLDIRSHVRKHRAELLILPEFAFLEPVWDNPSFAQLQWDALVREAAMWLARLPELSCSYVIGSMPNTIDDQPVNQGFLWSRAGGVTPLRNKYYLPDEPGGWEARWFKGGTEEFPAFSAGELKFGLNICTELWALETIGPYARAGVNAIVSPRATGAATTERWVSLAKTVAIRAGVFSLSSNRRHDDGSCGGVGWIIDPEGRELARTTPLAPLATVEINLTASMSAQSSYPRYVFADEPR